MNRKILIAAIAVVALLAIGRLAHMHFSSRHGGHASEKSVRR